jgi:hypothetical protein
MNRAAHDFLHPPVFPSVASQRATKYFQISMALEDIHNSYTELEAMTPSKQYYIQSSRAACKHGSLMNGNEAF